MSIDTIDQAVKYLEDLSVGAQAVMPNSDLSARLLEISALIDDEFARHHRRESELLAANNREVDRRRDAERKLRERHQPVITILETLRAMAPPLLGYDSVDVTMVTTIIDNNLKTLSSNQATEGESAHG